MTDRRYFFESPSLQIKNPASLQKHGPGDLTSNIQTVSKGKCYYKDIRFLFSFLKSEKLGWFKEDVHLVGSDF